ncbi:MAG: zf-TFIIB domain-containing protein [Thermoanaerobaculia bacterium]
MKPGEQVRCRCGKLVAVQEEAPRREAKMLHCSACGGKLREAAARCEYCGSEVSAADRQLGPACPECFARLRAGGRFCGQCGVAIRPEAYRATRAIARCPRCRGSLVLCELPEGHYTECSSCGGIWLDDTSFERVVEERDLAALGGAIVPRNPSALAAAAAAGAEEVRYLPCPTCGQMMHRKNFGACSGIIIDWCKGHGYWFDTHELEKVVQFVAGGGLDRAREISIQRAREELGRIQEAKRRAASGLTGGAAPVPAGDDWLSALGGIWWNLFHPMH